MKNSLKIIILVVTLLVGIACGYLVAKNTSEGSSVVKEGFTCETYTGKIEDLEYVDPNYNLTIGKNDSSFFIDIDLNFTDNGVVFDSDEAYMSVNLNGVIPYSIQEVEDYVPIALKDGKLPASFHIQLKEDTYSFDDESKQILQDYLSGNRNDETTVFSICVFGSDGKIMHVANKILDNNWLTEISNRDLKDYEGVKKV